MRAQNIRRREMAFLALAAQKSVLGLQKNFLAFRQIKVQNEILANQAAMDTYKEQLPDGTDYEEDEQYIYYEQLDERLQTEKESVDSQLTVIENELGSLKTLVNNSIKSSCTLNLAQ